MSTILFVSGVPTSIGHVFRVEHTVEALNSTGYTARWFAAGNPEIFHHLESCQAVVLFRVEWEASIEKVDDYCRIHGIPLIFDIDDLVFEPELMHEEIFAYLGLLPEHEKIKWIEKATSYNETLQHCQAAFLSTAPLARAASRYCDQVFILPNTLNHSMETDAAAAARSVRHDSADNRVRIGFASGTPTHHRDFAQVAVALAHLLSTRSDILLVIVGELDLSFYSELMEVKNKIIIKSRVPLHQLFDEFYQFDISLAPLEAGNPFCESKSELRYLFASAVSVPTVASPTEPIKNVITDYKNGMLAENKTDWERALIYLIDNPDIRMKMGEDAKDNILSRFSWQKKLDLTSRIFDQLLNKAQSAVK